MAPRDDSPAIVFLTCALSHVAMLPCIMQLHRRRWNWEMFILAGSMLCSFMYHTCQALNWKVFLTELQWHRLDNIFAIAGFAQLFSYVANFSDPTVEFFYKASGLLVGIIVQERDPWNVLYTVVPIVMFAIAPIVGLFTWNRNNQTLYDKKALAMGVGSFACAVPFFILGLDDDNDPYRVFHGTWHIVGSVAAYYLWRIVKNPQAIALQTLVAAEGALLHDRAGGRGARGPAFLSEVKGRS